MPSIIEITDVRDSRVEIFVSLTDAQLRQHKESQCGLFIAESPKVIDAALECGCVPIAMLSERKHIEGDASTVIDKCLGLQPQMPIYSGSREVLASIAGYTLTRGVLCAMQRPQALSLDDVCRAGRRWVVLDEVSDSTNVGSIFRSAAALGVDGIILTNTSCDPLGRRVVRVSMGTVFRIPWIRLPKDIDYLELLKTKGIASVALALRGDDISMDDEAAVSCLRGIDKMAIILGSEGYGMPLERIDRCDHVVRIPMARGVDSLNVGSTATLAIWALRPSTVTTTTTTQLSMSFQHYPDNDGDTHQGGD